MTSPPQTDPVAQVRALFERALSAHRRGDLQSAATDYAAILEIEPQNTDALHMFGMLQHQRGESALALGLLDQALFAALAPTPILANRASVLLATGDPAAAERDARDAAQRDPQLFGAWFNLGYALRALGRGAAASSAFARASALRPRDARALLEWFSCAAICSQSMAINQRVRESMPALASEREFALRTATELVQHGCAGPAFVVLSQLLRELPQDAEVGARVEIEARFGAAALLEQRQQTDAALAATEQLLKIAPAHRGTRMLRGSLLGERGAVQAAQAEYEQIVTQVPDDAIGGSALLIAMQHNPDNSADTIAAAHRAWAAQHMPLLAPAWPRQLPHADPARVLRIGWLSPRFFSGLVANFFLAALEQFERVGMRHFLYDNGAIDDAATARFRAAADEWHGVDTLDDAALCDKIRADRIDVLVEMSGHSPGNRLRALALRPAPVQLTWLDYFHSTGTPVVDVLLSDAVLSPPSLAAHYTERVLHLPSGRLCYVPPSGAPAVARREPGPLRFASFNRINKINDAVLATWARILLAIPGSVLRLKARAFDGLDERNYFIARCAQHGIARECLELFGYGSHLDVLAAYADVDIALDPFPFSGCATSLDALWMGVPVVTRIGATMVHRQTASLLHSLDLADLVAADEDDYVRRAVALANDVQRRRVLRAGLRARARTALCDAPRHAQELSAALRESWQLWCRGDLR